MSFSDEYFALQNNTKKKKKKDEKKSFSEQYEELQANPVVSVYTGGVKKSIERSTTPLRVGKTALAGFGSEDIAPTVGRFSGGSRSSGKFGGDKEKEERKWFDKGAFDDGYDFGDVTKTILGTVTDTAENLGAGIIGMGEKLVDTAAQLGAWSYGGLTPNEYGGYNYSAEDRVKAKEDAMDFIAKDLYDEEKVAKKIISNPIRRLTGIDAEEDSVFGEKTDALAQSGGQLLATVGLQAVGVPWFVTTGVTSYGGELENAYKQGATFSEAGASAAISAGAEILTEKLSGGIKFGGKALDDLAVSRLSRAISNKTLRTMAKFGLDAVGEGSEEVISQVFSNLGSSLYKEENLGELLTSEEAVDEYIESFIGGAVLGGGSNVINTVKSNKQGIDAVTGLTQNEQKVIDKVYQDAVAEAEQDGKKLTQKEKDKLYEDVLNQMDKGYISTDTIEEVLGGDTYRDYKNTVDYEDTLLEEWENLGNKQNATLAEQTRYNELLEKKKNLEQTSQRNALKSRLSEEVFGMVQSDRLAESYNERGRRSQAFEADLTQYDSKAQETIQKAIDSGILNNTNRTHEFVDLIAKISADKGVPFDFTNNQKLKDSGFAVEGKQVNGFVHNGNITLNIDSAKALQSTVGHEVTHVLEGTELYDALSQSVIEYAKSKGDYQGRYDTLSKLYEGVEGANIDAELTADLVGDYLFADTDFIHNLSTNHRNVFQKIYDEIKYLVKVATAGSKEARELARVQKAFEDAYRAEGKGADGTKYSLTDNSGKQLTKEQQEYFKDSKVRDENGNLLKVYHGSKNSGFNVFKYDPNVQTGTDYGEAYYFTSDRQKASGYSYDVTKDERVSQYKKEKDALRAKFLQTSSEEDKNAFLNYKLDGQSLFDLMGDESYLTEGGEVKEVYLNITNPLIADAGGKYYYEVYPEYFEQARANGNDGIIVKNVIDNPRGEARPIDTYIAFSQEQIKNTDNLNPTSDPDIRYSLSEQGEYSDTFYSQMGKVIDGVKQNKVGAASVVNMLRGKGVKAEEIKWSGIEEFLEGKKSVTKAELQEFVANSQLQIEEETLDNEEIPYTEEQSAKIAEYTEKHHAIMDELAAEWKRIVGSEAPFVREANINSDDIDRMLSDARKQRANETEAGARHTELQAKIREMITANDNFGFDRMGQPYRSIVWNPESFIANFDVSADDASLIREFAESKRVMDEIRATAEVSEQDNHKLKSLANQANAWSRKIADIKSEHYAENAKHTTKWGQYKLDGGENYREYLFKMPGSEYSNQAMATHWGGEQSGVLAHARVQDFDTPDGKMLFIEEIQSDWHNEGAKEGYADEDSKGFTQLELGEYQMQDNRVPIAEVTDAYGNVVAYVMKHNGKYVVDKANGSRFDSFQNEEDALYALKADAQYQQGTPDAPFRKNYHEFVLKNLIRKAAEDGYSSIGWTTADMQSERWSDEYAEGYRIEYDQDIPKFLSKYGKKWGAQVGKTKVNRGNPEVHSDRVEQLRRNIAGWRRDLDLAETDSEREFIQSQIDYERAELNSILDSGDEIWTMPITDAMKQSVLYEGQPLYSLSFKGEAPVRRRLSDIYGSDVKLETAPVEAPVTVAENATVEPMFPDDLAPVVDDAERIDSLTDADAPPEMEAPYYESEPQQTVKTPEERREAKLTAVQTELANNRTLRAESFADYNQDIARVQAEYDAKKNKTTKVAQDLLRRIERMKRLRDSTDADYAKRISDLETREKLIREGKPTTRQELHSGIVDNIKDRFAEKGLDFDKVLKRAKNLSTFATVDNIPQRVMEKALGYKEGQVLADETVNKVAQNESDGIVWLNSFTNRRNGLLAQLSKRYSIKPGSKESAAAQMYAEGFYVNENNDIIEYGDAELAKDFPDAKVQANIKGLASDPRIRQIYDETLAAINESRTRNAYPEIPRLDNYFLHFRAMDDTFSKLGLPFNPNDIRAKDLPTDLNGVTADLKPGQPYFASAMHRTGKRTSFDLLGGLERYLTSAKNQIYHIDDIQTLRALRNYIADTYGQANGLEGLDALSEEEAQDRIEKVYNAHLSTFAKFLNEEANILAGKTALIDRGLEGILGRRGMTFLDTVNKQVGSNMVGFNISSSLTNFIPVAQTFAKSNKFDFTKAFAQTVGNKVGSIFGRTDSFVESSPVIIRRKGADRFYRTPWQKAGDAGYVFMSAVDDISTELIARTKYNELTRKGMDSQKAHYETDKWVSRLMGDRSLGQMPQLYNSKMLGLITKFQLEVRNQLDAQFYDTIQEAKVSNEQIENGLARNAKTAAKVASTFVQLAVVQHLFGKAFESVAGYNPAFDIIEAVIKTFGFDDDEESEDTVLDNIEQGFLALLGDLPYTSTFTGGRIPISSALPIKELVKGEDEWGNEKPRLETLGEIAPYYILPGGYGQIKKTVQGLSMFSDEHPIAGSYTDSGNLRFPVEDTLGNRIQAGIFGQWASENARDYFDNERSPLKEKQIQEFIDVDIPIRDYWEYREGLSGLDKLGEKADYIAGLDLPIDKKNLLINNIADREKPIDMTGYEDFGSFDEFDFAVNNPEQYEVAQKVGGYEAYMKFQEGMKGMKLAEKADYIAGLDLTTAQKNALINGETDRKEPIDLTGYENYSSLEEMDYAKNSPENYAVAKAVGGYEAFKGYSDALYDIKADKDKNGKSISGSRKEKVAEYINNLDADYYTKIILFKYEYNADDTYNYEIIEYLNGRSDISFEEEIKILRKLGFEVDSKGNISW